MRWVVPIEIMITAIGVVVKLIVFIENFQNDFEMDNIKTLRINTEIYFQAHKHFLKCPTLCHIFPFNLKPSLNSSTPETSAYIIYSTFFIFVFAFIKTHWYVCVMAYVCMCA